MGRSYEMRIFLIILISALFSHFSFAEKIAIKNNPLATEDQHTLDQLATHIYQTYPFTSLRENAKEVYVKAYKKPLTKEAESVLNAAIDELIFSSIQKAVNDDPYHPKVGWVQSGPREWFGLDVPGGRYAYDNPDNIYRVVPIDEKLRYVIHGIRHSVLADASFSLIDNINSLKTVAILTNQELVLNSDGTYDITVDNQPANGRINHLQSTRKTRQLLIRNDLGNWQDEMPDSLTAELLDNNINHLPMSEARMVAHAAEIIRICTFGYGFGALGVKTKAKFHPVNTLSKPNPPSRLGGLVTQTASYGYFELDDTEALVLTLDPAGAHYFVIPETGPWMTSLDPGHCQSSLNNMQSFANADGKYRFVISRKDPNVYNWISTCDLHEGTIMVRWQVLPDKNKVPPIQTAVVPLSDLAIVLPSDTQWITPLERQQLQSARLEGYQKRSANV